MIFKKSILSILFSAITFFTCSAFVPDAPQQGFTPPKHEVRAVWLATIGGLDWPHSYARSSASAARQQAELTATLDRLHHAGINTVLFQTRIRGTVVYPSDIEPWDGCMSGIPGRSPGYDPLAFAIQECHRRGMEIQTWVVAVPVGRWNGLGCRTLRRKYPAMIVRRGDEGFIDPSNAMAAPYIASLCREITARYDIDGIHLDYIRYPETWSVSTARKDAARRNITAIVREAHNAVKTLKPWVKMSCSPIGKYSDLNRYSSRGWNAYGKGCQDAQLWLKTGLMDQLYPMMYFRDNQFYPFVMDWIENSAGRTVVPGLGVYFLSPHEADWPADVVRRQVGVLRNLGTGFAYFRSKFLCDDVKGLYRFTSDQVDRWPALVPPMTWACSQQPEAPCGICVSHSGGNVTVSWTAPRHVPDGGIYYNVYASRDFPVDVTDPRNLIAVRTDRTQVTLRQSATMHYAVTAMNRYGLESSPVMTENLVRQSVTDSFICNDGRRMQLPDKGQTLDADFIIIESITGQSLATMPYRGRYADISCLKDGLYTVKSLNRRNVIHRLGHLLIRR